jgi:glycine betaine/proline transport system substrate-binding protein
LFKAFKIADKNFVLVDPGSAAGLDGSMIKSYERHEGWLGQYWTPTSMLGKYEFVLLDLGVAHDAAEWKRCTTQADCPDPKPNAWPVDHVEVLISKKFADRQGPELDYLKKRNWKNADLNKLLAWMADNQATGEDGAKHFLKENKAIWESWVSPEVASKLEASL